MSHFVIIGMGSRCLRLRSATRPLFQQYQYTLRNYNLNNFRNNGTTAAAATTAPAIPSAANLAAPPVAAAVDAPSEIIPTPDMIGYIPPPPPEIPLEFEPVSTVVSSLSQSQIVLNAAGEPTFASIGLGSWWPPGIVQQCLEFMHINMGLPWWAAIVAGTVIIRLALFPIVVKSQRNAAKMANEMPTMVHLQQKMTEARQSGDAYLSAKYGHDLMTFMKEKQISPFKSMLVPLAMTPVFISVFFGLRKMANLPVESMREGGLFWFTDLTMADPFYLLPLITSTTLWITLEVGADGVRLNASQFGHLMKYFMRIMPIIVFPMTMNFPAALLCYWASTNMVSLIQVSIMKLPAVREALKIPIMIKHDPASVPQNKGFKAGVKETWTNMKITKEVENRERYDEIAFKRAGAGPIPKTYKYDPTRAAAAAGKARDVGGVSAKQQSRN